MQRHSDRVSESVVLLVIAGLFILIAVTDVEALQPFEMLRVLSAWGFAEELFVAFGGVVALAFFAGGARKEVVAAGAIVVLLLANSTMVNPTNMLTTYPTAFGKDRITLIGMAEESPNLTISGEIPVLLRLGEVIGTGRLIMPLSDLGDRLRAFTAIDVVFVPGPYGLAPADWEEAWGQEEEVGILETTTVFVVGSGDEYVWVDRSDAVFVVSTDLLSESPG